PFSTADRDWSGGRLVNGEEAGNRRLFAGRHDEFGGRHGRGNGAARPLAEADEQGAGRHSGSGTDPADQFRPPRPPQADPDAEQSEHEAAEDRRRRLQADHGIADLLPQQRPERLGRQRVLLRRTEQDAAQLQRRRRTHRQVGEVIERRAPIPGRPRRIPAPWSQRGEDDSTLPEVAYERGRPAVDRMDYAISG